MAQGEAPVQVSGTDGLPVHSTCAGGWGCVGVSSGALLGVLVLQRVRRLRSAIWVIFAGSSSFCEPYF